MKRTKVTSVVSNMEKFMNKATFNLHELQELNEELEKKVQKENLTQKRKDEIYSKRFNELKESLTSMQKSDKRAIENMYNENIDYLKENEESITGDINAELDALSKIQLTEDMVKEYSEKYAKNKLAFLRFEQIASKQGFSTPITYRVTEQINDLDNFKNTLYEQYANSKFLIESGILSTDNDMLSITNDVELNVIKDMANEYENKYYGSN